MKVQKDIILSNLNTSGVGGPAKYFYSAKTPEKMVEAINWALSKKLPYLILGSGSNVLIADDGFPGLVIKNSIKGIIGFRQILKVGSGTLLSQLVSLSVKQDLTGVEKLAGIPGTVGGAIYGNAGAYGTAASDNLTRVICFDPQKKAVVSLTKKQCKFDYRDSIFKKNNYVILEAHFKLAKAQPHTVAKEVKNILKTRAGKNFWEGKNPGSFFKNIPVENMPPESLKLIPKDKIVHGKITAGFLLDSIGAKGKKVGDVKVSNGHANLIVNTGNAKTADFIELASSLIKEVKEKFGVTLEPEVQLINTPPLTLQDQ
ncbi:MAG: UDP-N-acetylmuramate dehydrogenase [Candidatus Daviesbacteria bacterium]|nr:UDP-N-acetylmuramate dehydrogenase [Candidatus Daviesbacteria bacterium]